ncbi:MAG: DegT/DnrJ/EryC1/StrS family aminotransferase [Candidatus Poseidoniales archaeon]|nr:DegT/DnrJ/EryC1/StrS family aminotransferase [Candidatus Poseidoniales archaeon]
MSKPEKQTQGGEPFRRIMLRIPLARPSWDDEMRQAAIATLDSKQWVKGQQNIVFGQSFADYCGALAATPCQNGSVALWAALQLAEISAGDEVIVPSLTFIASATAISLVGATAVFVDVDEYYCMDYHAVKEAITEKTKAVIAVHLFGQIIDPRIVELCQQNQLTLIEDAAQAHGASITDEAGKKTFAGAIGDIACFSFFPSKNMAVGGEGGMITTSNIQFVEQLDSIVNHGRNSRIEAQHIGSNLRMSEVSAAIGTIQLSRLDNWLQQRRNIATRYLQECSSNPKLVMPKIRESSEHAWHQFCIVVEDEVAFIKHLDEELIDARVHYPIPCHKQPVFSNHSQHHTELIRTDSISNKLVAIPVFHEMRTDEVERVIDALNSY